MTPSSNRALRGNTTVVALLMLFVLSLVGANVLYNISARYNTTQKNIGWQEALFAAESGADVALANLRWTKISGTNTAFAAGTNDDGSYWGWLKPSGSNWVPCTSATDGSTQLSGTKSLTYNLPTLSEGGDGTTQIWAKVVLDGPPMSNSGTPKGLVDSKGNQWYRIRSTGYAALTGMSRVGDDIVTDMNARHKNALRKFSFKYDRYESFYNNRLVALAKPQAQRTIEVLVQPKTPFEAAVIAGTSFNGPGSAGVIDSFDSTNTAKSTNAQYDSSKRQQHGDVLLNTAATSSNFSVGGTIYGDVGSNGGTFTNIGSVTGSVNNNAYTYLPPVNTPTWTTINATPTTVTSNTTINIPAANNTLTNPARYKLATITKTLTVTPPSGSDGYAEIWVTGDITGAITINDNTSSGSQTGAHVKIYFAGNINVKGRDLTNNPYSDGLQLGAAYLQFYGINPSSG